MSLIEIDEEEYYRLCQISGGICLHCGELQEGGVEPDASGYKCGDCGLYKVEGIESALIMGCIEIAGD